MPHWLMFRDIEFYVNDNVYMPTSKQVNIQQKLMHSFIYDDVLSWHCQ